MGRCYEPTSATELTTRAPVDRSTSEPAAVRLRRPRRRGWRPKPREPTRHGVEPPCDNSTPDGYVLDGTYPASAPLGKRPTAPKGGRARRRLFAAPFAAAFSTANEVAELASDALCRAARRTLSRPVTPRQARFHHALVKERGFHEPGRLPSTSAPDSPLSRTARKPATDLAALPPATRLPTCFHRPALSRGTARPAVELRALRS
jgi:hypothetical protein